MKVLEIYALCVGIMSVIAFGVCGLDKWKAKKGRWRVPEKVLFLLAGLGGAWGVPDGDGGVPPQDQPLVLPHRSVAAFRSVDGGDGDSGVENRFRDVKIPFSTGKACEKRRQEVY